MGATADSMSAGGPPKKHGGRKRLTPRFRNGVVKAAPFPICQCIPAVRGAVHLHPIHAQVVCRVGPDASCRPEAE